MKSKKIFFTIQDWTDPAKLGQGNYNTFLFDLDLCPGVYVCAHINEMQDTKLYNKQGFLSSLVLIFFGILDRNEYRMSGNWRYEDVRVENRKDEKKNNIGTKFNEILVQILDIH